MDQLSSPKSGMDMLTRVLIILGVLVLLGIPLFLLIAPLLK